MERKNSLKRQEMEIQIKQLLFNLPLTERIAIIERIGKQYRQQNSREISKEVSEFTIKNGNKKKIDEYPV